MPSDRPRQRAPHDLAQASPPDRSLVGTFGERKPGGYFWRPPGLEHGPLTTEFTDKGTFSWRPKYRPVLPRELRRYIGKPYAGNRNY